MVTKPPPKQPLSCRVQADVLARLQSEAAEQGASFALYIETCITNYQSVAQDLTETQRNEKFLLCQLANVKEQVETLWQENSSQSQKINNLDATSKNLATEIEALRAENKALKNQLEEAESKNENLMAWAETLRETIEGLEKTSQTQKAELATKTRSETELTAKVHSSARDNQNLRDSIRVLIAEKELLQVTLNQRLPNWLTEDAVQHVKKYLDKIHKKYPSVSHEDLLVLATATTSRNENHTLRMFNIEDFWNRNPDFFTIQAPSVSTQ